MDIRGLQGPIHQLVPGMLVVGPQPTPQQLQAIRDAGFASVINNRPDGEGGAEQPTSAQMAAAAQAAGLEYRHLPVPPRDQADADARRMVELVDALPKPVFAFCRSGARAAALYHKGRSLG